jgi:hypothetical protein
MSIRSSCPSWKCVEVEIGVDISQPRDVRAAEKGGHNPGISMTGGDKAIQDSLVVGW